MTEMTQTELAATELHAGKWKCYPAYKYSGIEWLREIPAHWEVKRLKFFANVNMGQSPDSNNYNLNNIGLPFLQGNAEFGQIHPKPKLWCETARKFAKPMDILLSVRAPVGQMNVSDQVYGIGRGLCAITVQDQIDRNYLWFLLQVIREGLLCISTDSTYEAVSVDEVKCLVGLVPPLSEQHSIAAFLDRETTKINTLLAKKERLIELLQEKRTALISNAVTKGLDPTVLMKDLGIEWLGEIPTNWEVKRLKFVTSFVTSGSRGWAQYYSDDGATFIRIGNLSRTSIALDLQDIQYVSPPDGAEGERTRVRQHDVLISITAYIGSVAVVSEDIGEAYVNQHIALSRPRLNVIASKWLGYCLLSQVGQSQFHLLLYGGTKDGLGLDDVKNLHVLVPPFSEQQAIVTYLDRETTKIDALISRIREGIEKLKEYSTALISAAVTGKIDVRDEVTAQDELSTLDMKRL